MINTQGLGVLFEIMLPFINSVTLDLNVSVTQFLICKIGIKNSVSLMGWLWEVNKLVHRKTLDIAWFRSTEYGLGIMLFFKVYIDLLA